MNNYDKPDNRPKIVNTYNVKKKSSKEYYDDSPSSKKNKKDYDTDYHKTPARKAYRAELARKRREKGLMGTAKGKGKDISHTKAGGFKVENASKNRARNRGKA